MTEKEHRVKTREEVLTFIEWLRYDDELFTLFGLNKISANDIYNRFLDETKNY